jgi:hypothetical protein
MTEKNIIVVRQEQHSSFDYHMTVVAKYDHLSDAKELIEAKRIAHELELKASNEKYATKYNYFAVNLISQETMDDLT